MCTTTDAARYGQLCAAGSGANGSQQAAIKPAPATTRMMLEVPSDPPRTSAFQPACRKAPKRTAIMTAVDRISPASPHWEWVLNDRVERPSTIARRGLSRILSRRRLNVAAQGPRKRDEAKRGTAGRRAPAT